MKKESPTRFANAAFDAVAMAASAGGLSALSLVLSGLPADFPAAILVVQHLDPRHRSLMADIMARRTSLRSSKPRKAIACVRGRFTSPLRTGTCSSIQIGRLSLSQSELVHFLRPSADLLFESVAAVFKDRAIAVVLTGTGHDGSMGVKAIRKMGGTVIAQDEETSEFFGMPEGAIQTGSVDFILPLREIPSALVTLVMKGGEK